MVRWIDQQAGKAARQKAQREALVAAALRHRAEAGERAAFHAELKAEKEKPVPVPRRGIVPGVRRLPSFTDEELASALGRADPAIPRHLDYPHLLMLRERGFTRMVWADVGGSGEFGAPTYRGDVITEVGVQWLKTHNGGA